MKNEIGSPDWNDEMYVKHATPYSGIAGYVEKKRLRRILSHIKTKKQTSILEVGCEAGGLLEFLKNKLVDCHFTGMDISTEALKKAEEKLGKDVSLIQQDITKPLLEKVNIPDYLICSETLEHIPNAEKALEGIHQLTGKDTTVIITVPIEKYKNQIKRILTKTGLFNRLFPGIENALSEWHVQDFSKQDLYKLVGERFTVLHYETILLMHQLIILKPKSA